MALAELAAFTTAELLAAAGSAVVVPRAGTADAAVEAWSAIPVIPVTAIASAERAFGGCILPEAERRDGTGEEQQMSQLGHATLQWLEVSHHHAAH